MARTTAKTRNPLAQAPLDELAAELTRRKAALPKLLERRDRLRAELEQVESQIAMLESLEHGGPRPSRPAKRSSAAAGRRRGPGGGPTLREKIGQVLGSDPMRPVQIANALVERGLHEGSKSLQVQVSGTLARFDEFSKVARGQWVRSGDAGASTD